MDMSDAEIKDLQYNTLLTSQTLIDALALARTVCGMGAGRYKTTDVVDLAVGLQLHVAVGHAIAAGAPWLTIHHVKPVSEEHLAALQASVTISDACPDVPSRFVGLIEGTASTPAAFHPF